MLEGTGGRDIGPFRSLFSMSPPFEWTNREESGVIDRRRPLSLEWREDSRDRLMIILATNVDQITTATGTCVCVARGDVGRFVIPPSLLANLPRSQDPENILYDRLYLASMSSRTPPSILAPGLDHGTVISLNIVGRFVEYR
jgi:hypothetical protein